MIKYRTRLNEIEAIEIERETEKQVVVKSVTTGYPYRENKRSDWSNWHDSWDDAYAFLVARADEEIMKKKRALLLAEAELERIKNMKQPS